jgi:lipoprotein-anchoring transpeptidase ErfK/SrfK
MRGRTAVAALAAMVAAVLGLAGCTSAPEPPPSGEQLGGVTTSTTATQPPEPFSLKLTPADKAEDVEPGAPVTVAVGGGLLTEVVLTNEAGKVVKGSMASDGRTWTSAEPLGYGKTYTTKATGQDAEGKATTSTSTFTTARPARTSALSMNPLDGQEVGVGQPLAFYFSTAIRDKAAAEKAIRITSEPETAGAYYWFDDSTVMWRPQEYWKPGTKVTIDARVYGKHFGNGTYGAEDRKAVITIGDAVVMKADGKSHTMTVSINGKVARTIPISMGKPGYETPVGTYVVMSEHTDYVMDSSTYGVPTDAAEGYRTHVEVATRMSNSGIFYHSAPWSVGDQGKRNVSHGCINVSTENARWLQKISAKGDVITVSGSGGPKLEVWDGLGVWQVPWETWKKGGAR